MNLLLQDLNKNGWFLMFSWQMSDGTLHKVLRRSKSPEFVVSVSGIDENRMYGDAIVKCSWIDKFIEENELENKYAEFMIQKAKIIKEIVDKVNVEKVL